jgi:hypothetical protein
MQALPSEAARALADALLTHAEALNSTVLEDVVVALPAIRAAARQLGGLLEERGWGTDILYGWPGLQDEGEDYEDTEIEVEGDELNAAGDLPDDYDDAEDPPLDGTRISYQARFDFVIVDEEALHARAEARSREVNPEADAEAGMQEFGGPLSLLLYLDNPTFRGYEAAGIEMVYGHEVVRPVERTLDEYEYDAQDDHFPVE